MFHCIIFYNSSKIYLQFPYFPDKFKLLVESKMAAILTVILNGSRAPSSAKNPYCLPYLVEHMTGYLLGVKYFPNILTSQNPRRGVAIPPPPPPSPLPLPTLYHGRGINLRVCPRVNSVISINAKKVYLSKGFELIVNHTRLTFLHNRAVSL